MSLFASDKAFVFYFLELVLRLPVLALLPFLVEVPLEAVLATLAALLVFVLDAALLPAPLVALTLSMALFCASLVLKLKECLHERG